MEDWKKEIKDQDKDLAEIHNEVKVLNLKNKQIGQGIDLSGKAIDKTNRMADKTETNIVKSSKKLKEILDKVGGATNFCIDIVLVCVCLGLIVVLYNVIKGQTSKTATTTAAVTPATTKSKLFLMN